MGHARDQARAGHLDRREVRQFRNSANQLLKRRWHVLTLATLAGQLTVFVVLLTSLRVLGVPSSDVNAVEVFASWSLVRLLGSIPITPGGLGVVELGLTTALVGFGGNQPDVVAAVLVYRFLTMAPTLVIGLLAGATWKKHRPDYLSAPAGAAPLPPRSTPMSSNAAVPTATSPSWAPERPRFRPLRMLSAWLVSGLALLVAAALVPHASVEGLGGAIVAAALIAILNAVLPPIVAALRLPFALVAGFLLVLVLDAFDAAALVEDRAEARSTSTRSGGRSLTALLASAVTIVLDAVFGTNDDDTYTFRVVQRIARRSGAESAPTCRGSSSSRSTGSRSRCCGARCATETPR